MDDFTGKTIVITGGTGVLGGAIAHALEKAGANLVLITRDPAKVKGFAHTRIMQADVLDRSSLERAAEKMQSVDGLVNAAGGNDPRATTSADQEFFDLPLNALREVFDLNVLGTILPCQVFGRVMAQKGEGAIVNISSMSAFQPLTRIPAYSAAKAGVNNFTQWLAVHLAQEYSPRLRVNAIAPGFFLTEQNRFLLTHEQSGELTARGKNIIARTPMGRFGKPEDLIGAVMWLLSPASEFVTGAVIPLDGGFSAFAGI